MTKMSKILNKILILLLLVTALMGLSLEQEFNMFTEEQYSIAIQSYGLGEPFGMGYTMAAIAWQESSSGTFLLNMNDPSAGVFANYIPSVLARHGIKDTQRNRNIMAQKLMNSIDLSAAEALSELEYWKSIHGESSWPLLWQSYNGGFSYKSPGTSEYINSIEYSNDIRDKVHFLQKNLFTITNFWTKNNRTKLLWTKLN